MSLAGENPRAMPGHAQGPVVTVRAPRPQPSAPAPGKPQPNEEPDLKERAIENAPPWLISAVVHLVAVILLGLIWYSGKNLNPVDLDAVWSETLGSQLDDPSMTEDRAGAEVDGVIVSGEDAAMDDPFAAPPQMAVSLDGQEFTTDLTSPQIGLALSGRNQGMQDVLLRKYGGNKLTADAVDAGLAWLAKQQRSDGTWSLKGPYTSGARQECVAAATAMAMLAFQGDGHTHQTGEYGPVMQKAMSALVKMQDAEGSFWQGEREHDWLYSHSQGTIAICELYGMTKDPALKEPAQRAIDFLVGAQDALGGWKYQPRQGSDTSVTGWAVVALQSGLMADLNVPTPTLSKISSYLDKAAREGGVKYSYQPGMDPDLVMTAEGLLCRQYLGWAQNDERLIAGAEYLVRNRMNYHDRDVYYWYYATQVLHHMEGKYWDAWNEVMRQELPKRQMKTGREAGSWDPDGENPDAWGSTGRGEGGRLYVTCLSIYMLEVYYRHLPIYRTKDFLTAQ
jgi:hypothetical protein